MPCLLTAAARPWFAPMASSVRVYASPFTMRSIHRRIILFRQIRASAPTRIFEAAGAGACVVSDAWTGIEQFLEPDSEILVANSGADVAGYVDALDESMARRIGEAARKRVLAEHTYALRAAEVESV